MKKVNIELENLNQISEEWVNERVEENLGIIKVTNETYYLPYDHEGDDEHLKQLAEEWFHKYGGTSHAYRDGSKFPFVNLVKVEILKRK